MNKPFYNKTPEMVAAIEKFFPGTVQAIRENKCPCCTAFIVESAFKDALSLKEYSISGMCQTCQDECFTNE